MEMNRRWHSFIRRRPMDADARLSDDVVGPKQEVERLRGLIRRYLVAHDAGIVHATAGDSEYSTREEMRRELRSER